MDCVGGTFALLAVAASTGSAAVVALILGFLPHERERRRRVKRAQFLRAHLLNQMALMRGCLSPRDRAMPPEQESIIDAFVPLIVQAEVLEVEEWLAILRAQSAVIAAKNRVSYNKREARVAERALDEATAVLQTYAGNGRPRWSHDAWSLLIRCRSRPARRSQAESMAADHPPGGRLMPERPAT